MRGAGLNVRLGCQLLLQITDIRADIALRCYLPIPDQAIAGTSHLLERVGRPKSSTPCRQNDRWPSLRPLTGLLSPTLKPVAPPLRIWRRHSFGDWWQAAAARLPWACQL